MNKSKIFNIITNMFVFILLSFAIIGFWRIFNQNPKNTLYNSSIATVLSGLFTGCLAYLGVRWSVANATKNSKESMLSNTVTKERIVWQNKLRDKFGEYNKIIFEISRVSNRLDFKNKTISKELQDKVTECHSVIRYINLLLNPSEKPHKKLIYQLQRLITESTKVKLDINIIETLDNVEFMQQVILKFEWKRIKEEAEKGQKLSDERIDELYKITALKINEKLAEEILGYTNCCICSCKCRCK
ncbi:MULTISPECIES: APC family permease [Bacillus]|uniref:APC family permease n=1 Tax=Bacillus TaxID=1386 RepID=UPI00105E7587|nr:MULTISPECIES: APC family permease [Bacillus]TDU16456.1 hypothetical protein EV579_0712 [Bacillus sp. BK450]